MTDERRRDDIDSKVDQIHAALITGLDGKPGLLERVSRLEDFKCNLSRWTKAIIGITITNLGAFITQIVLLLMKKDMG